MPSIDGKTVRCATQNPLAMIWLCAKDCECFTGIMEHTLAKHPMPWRMILYNDNISPADSVAKRDDRKAAAIYYSFLEFGMEVLSCEDFDFALLANTIAIIITSCYLQPTTYYDDN